MSTALHSGKRPNDGAILVPYAVDREEELGHPDRICAISQVRRSQKHLGPAGKCDQGCKRKQLRGVRLDRTRLDADLLRSEMDDLLTQTQDPCRRRSIGIDERRVSQGPWPSLDVNDILQTLWREMQVGKGGSDEQLSRLVVRVVVDQVRIGDNRRPERRHD